MGAVHERSNDLKRLEQIDTKPKNLSGKIDNFNKELKHGQYDPLKHLADKMHDWSENGSWAKARGANFGLIGCAIGEVVLNTVRIGLNSIFSPIAIPLHLGARFTRFVVLKTRTDGEENTFKRRILKGLPGFIEKSNTFKSIGRAAFRIAKLVIAIFASLTIGFISVKANLWIFHKLGLVSVSHFANEDRKKIILDYVKEMEGTPIEKVLSEKFEHKVTQQATLQLRKQIFGENIFRGRIENEHIWDQNSRLKEALREATIQKRKASVAALVERLGRSIDNVQFEIEIKQPYWGTVIVPEKQKEISKHSNQAIEKYKEYVSNKFIRNFDVKNLEEFEKEYYNWNLTYEEVHHILNEEIEKINDPTNSEIAAAEAEKFLMNLQNTPRRKLMRKEFISDQMDKRISEILKKKEEKIDHDFAEGKWDEKIAKIRNSELQRFKGKTSFSHEWTDQFNSHVKKLIKAERLQAVYAREKALILAEKAITKASDIEKDNLPNEKVDEIINKQAYAFTDDEKVYLRNFALTAFNNLVEQSKIIKEMAKKRPMILPAEAIYKNKNMVMRELLNEFPLSKFQRIKQPKIVEGVEIINNAQKIDYEPIDRSLMEKAEAEIQKEISALPAIPKEVDWQKAENDRQIKIAHLQTIEKMRKYQELAIEKLLPRVEDDRYFKDTDIGPRPKPFDVLKKCRDHFEEFKKGVYATHIITNMSGIEGGMREVEKIENGNIIHKKVFDNGKTNHPVVEIKSPVTLVFPQKDPETGLIKEEETKVIFEKYENNHKKKTTPQRYGRIPQREYTFAELDALTAEMKQVHAEAAKKYAHNKRAFAVAFDPNNGSETIYWRNRQESQIRSYIEGESYEELNKQLESAQNSVNTLSEANRKLNIELTEAKDTINTLLTVEK